MSAVTDQQMLDAINSAILALVTGGVASYGIAGRQLTKLPLAELQKMKAEYEVRVLRASSGSFSVGTFRNPE
jgi:hypothetical protein